MPTILDWMRPYDPKTLVKPVYDEIYSNEVDSDAADESSYQ